MQSTQATDLTLADLQAFDPQPMKAGKYDRYLCPVNGCSDGKPKDKDHKSLSVERDTGKWRCHRCKSWGTLKDCWTDRPQQTAKERQREQTRRAILGDPKPKHQEDKESADKLRAQLASVQSFAGTPAESYLQGRGIDPNTARSARVKYSATWGKSDKWDGQPAAVFPIVDATGKTIAAQGRAVKGDSKITYGNKLLGVFSTSDALIADPVAITEAPIDALSLAVSGLPALATCGKSWPEWLKQKLAFRRVFIATDSDKDGEQMAQELGEELTAFGARCVRLRPARKDWNDVLRNDGPEAVSDAAMAAFMAVSEG